MGEIWLDLSRLIFVNSDPKVVRRLVFWDSVVGLEENTTKAYKKANTIIITNNSEPIWVIETINEILEQAGVHMRGSMGFKGEKSE